MIKLKVVYSVSNLHLIVYFCIIISLHFMPIGNKQEESLK